MKAGNEKQVRSREYPTEAEDRAQHNAEMRAQTAECDGRKASFVLSHWEQFAPFISKEMRSRDSPLSRKLQKAVDAWTAGQQQGKSSKARIPVHRQPDCIKNGEMHNYQLAGLKWMVAQHDKGAGGILGDEMGLGKTIQAIAVASFYRDEWPVLVICPSSVRLSWRDEFLRWLPGDVLRAHHVEVVVNGKAVLTSSSSRWGRESVGRKGKSPTGKKVIIVSYDLVPKLLDQIQQVLNKLVFLLPFHNVGCVV